MNEFEQVQKSLGGAPLASLPRQLRGIELLIEHPLLVAASSAAEIEPAHGELAHAILQKHPSLKYTGIFREVVTAEASDRLAGLGHRAILVRGAAEGELPLEPKSQDVLLTCFALESMRMNHLYMACSEARRVLREGGHWLILARDTGRTPWEKLVSYVKGKAGRPSLNVTHYISPEDWQTEQDTFLPGMTRLLVLRRLSDLPLG